MLVVGKVACPRFVDYLCVPEERGQATLPDHEHAGSGAIKSLKGRELLAPV